MPLRSGKFSPRSDLVDYTTSIEPAPCACGTPPHLFSVCRVTQCCTNVRHGLVVRLLHAASMTPIFSQQHTMTIKRAAASRSSVCHVCANGLCTTLSEAVLVQRTQCACLSLIILASFLMLFGTGPPSANTRRASLHACVHACVRECVRGCACLCIRVRACVLGYACVHECACMCGRKYTAHQNIQGTATRAAHAILVARMQSAMALKAT